MRMLIKWCTWLVAIFFSVSLIKKILKNINDVLNEIEFIIANIKRLLCIDKKKGRLAFNNSQDVQKGE